jgi:Tfp pilus assembly protein PilX
VRRPNRSRRAAALVMAVLMLAAVNLAVISAINGGGDDARLASTRADTVRAFYAAESGAALVVGEYNAGRTVPTGTFTVSAGATAVISASAGTVPMDVVVIGKFGQAQRRIELRIE